MDYFNWKMNPERNFLERTILGSKVAYSRISFKDILLIYILGNKPGEGILTDVIWGKEYDKGKIKMGKM
jgi:hypothetical protein